MMKTPLLEIEDLYARVADRYGLIENAAGRTGAGRHIPYYAISG